MMNTTELSKSGSFWAIGGLCVKKSQLSISSSVEQRNFENFDKAYLAHRHFSFWKPKILKKVEIKFWLPFGDSNGGGLKIEY